MAITHRHIVHDGARTAYYQAPAPRSNPMLVQALPVCRWSAARIGPSGWDDETMADWDMLW